MRICILVLWLLSMLLPIYTTAQTMQDLFEDTDVLWAGEFSLNFLTKRNQDPASLDTRVGWYNGFSYAKNLKSDPKDSIDVFDLYLNKYAKQIPFYKESNLAEQLPLKELRNKLVDSVDYLTSNYESATKVIELSTKDIEYFRVKGYLFYSKKEAAFKTVFKSGALIINRYDDMGNVLFQFPLAFVPVVQLEEGAKVNVEGTAWARQVFRTIDLKDVYVFKRNPDLRKVLAILLKDVQDAKQTVFSAESLELTNKMSKTQKKQLPAGLAKNQRAIKLQLIHNFYFNSQTKQMEVQQVGFAPVVTTFEAYTAKEEQVLFYKTLNKVK